MPNRMHQRGGQEKPNSPATDIASIYCIRSAYCGTQWLAFARGRCDQLRGRARRAPARAPAVASSDARRTRAGWRRAVARHISATGNAGTRAGALTTRSAGASARASAGTSPMPSPPDTYESSSDTLGTSIVDTGRIRSSAKYWSSSARPRLSAARRRTGSRRSRSVSGVRARPRPEPTHAGQRRRARGGQPHAPAGAREELHAEVGLELADLRAHGRRGDVALARGRPDRARARHRQQGLEGGKQRGVDHVAKLIICYTTFHWTTRLG